jgi:8-oxo-dGTP pyrophosphatase MutT (NUDIX family)
VSERGPAPTPCLTEIVGRLAGYQPRLESPPERLEQQAAVALIFLHGAQGDTPELLFIERASREGDPWSGQMAFPGGRRAPSDASLEATAARETLEEVGIELPAAIARLDDFTNLAQVRRFPELAPVCVGPYVFELRERPALHCSDEVASAIWVPLHWILHPGSASTYELQHTAFQGTFPAFVYERYKVWGMTYRILECLAEAIQVELPARRVFSMPLGERERT